MQGLSLRVSIYGKLHALHLVQNLIISHKLTPKQIAASFNQDSTGIRQPSQSTALLEVTGFQFLGRLGNNQRIAEVFGTAN